MRYKNVMHPITNNYLGTPYPNPHNGTISFNIHLSEDKEAYIFIINPLGETINIIHDGILESTQNRLTLQWASILNSAGVRVDDGYYRVIADYGNYECFYNISIRP